MTLREIESKIAALSRAEKAQIIQSLVHDLFDNWPGIEKTSGVSGGEACIVRTRVPVSVLENYRRLGWSEARILENFPTLRAADLVNAWSYADSHPDEIELAIQENETA